jgi:Fe2+ transport system protein FeoA
MEHSLSDESMDRLTRLFEFFKTCPEEDRRILERFQETPGLKAGAPARREKHRAGARPRKRSAGEERTLADLAPGMLAVVSKVRARGAVRRRLLDMGILPDVEVTVTRVEPAGGRLHIDLQGFELHIDRAEAEAVLIRD